MMPGVDEPLEWLGAEGEKNGLPVLMRMRAVPLDHAVRGRYPHLLVTTWKFPSHDGSGLPSDADYAAVGEFEASVLDRLEEKKLGVTAIVVTHAGVVEHVLYVANVERARTFVGNSGVLDRLRMSALEGDAWKEYDRRVRNLVSD
jgi:hypothetical protein